MTHKIAVHGAGGRMGRTILALLSRDADASIAAALDRAEHPFAGQDVGRMIGEGEIGVPLTHDLSSTADVDVVIDFSSASAVLPLLQACERRRLPVVVGTTGFDAAVRSQVEALSKVAPVLVAPNMSVGVNVLFYLTKLAAQLLGPEYDIEIVEMHHRAKIDAPSGTANRLYEAAADARGLDRSAASVHGRSGIGEARPRDVIGVMSLRGGDVVGDHTVVFAGPGERVELTHRAHTREIFAGGAIRAAHFLVGKKPAIYDMNDVIGIPR